jgi:hypothetical protein
MESDETNRVLSFPRGLGKGYAEFQNDHSSLLFSVLRRRCNAGALTAQSVWGVHAVAQKKNRLQHRFFDSTTRCAVHGFTNENI